MKLEKNTARKNQSAETATPRKSVAVVGPTAAKRDRLQPLDACSVNKVFVAHDRFRAFLRSS